MHEPAAVECLKPIEKIERRIEEAGPMGFWQRSSTDRGVFLLVEEPPRGGNSGHAHGHVAGRIPDIVPDARWKGYRVGEELHDEDGSTPNVKELLEVDEILVPDRLNPRELSRKLKVGFGVILAEQLQSDPLFGVVVPRLVDLTKSSAAETSVDVEAVETVEDKTRVCQPR
jgi:hypothetical protein